MGKMKTVNNNYFYNVLDVVRNELIGNDYHFFFDVNDNDITIFYKHESLDDSPKWKIVLTPDMFVGTPMKIYTKIFNTVVDNVINHGICSDVIDREKYINKLLTLEV